MKKHRTLVIGLGNVLLKDEGTGIHIIERIQACLKDTPVKDSGMALKWPDAEFMTGGTSGLDILEHFQGRDRIIIIDAAQTDDPPGTLYRLNGHDLKAFFPGKKLSMHNINLHDVLNLASFLHRKIPEIVIIAINVKDTSPGEYLTEEVEKKIPDILALIQEECTRSTRKISLK